MSKIRLVLVAAVILGLSAVTLRAAPPPTGQAKATKLDVLVDAIRSNRKAMVAANLKLSDEEAAKFWPIYDRYQQELSATGDRMLAIINDYIAHFSDLSNEKALQLIEDYNAAETDRLKVRRSYIPEFAKVVPGRTVARFYQIENKMDAVIRYDLAASIPVVEQPTAAGGK